jgi:LmbE family N-acetylglucosaminyl deacetylase
VRAARMPMAARARDSAALSEPLHLTARDRVLVVAPHPDDESIATGGIVLAARAAGAALRVIVLTDGDNNPWPQRWVEKRWTIDAAAQARWGARRRGEAGEAMRLLGVAERDARFFGLPDQGLTDLLMRAERKIIDDLAAEIETFKPTEVVVPALSDRHPDHSAAFILVAEASARAGASLPHVLTFAVHGGGSEKDAVVLALSDAQRETKRSAIRAHASQMHLGGERFLKFARSEESYRRQPLPPAVDPDHPLRARFDGGRLRTEIDRRIWKSSLRGLSLLIVGNDVRWSVPIDESKASLSVQDCATGTDVAVASLNREGDELIITVPVATAAFPGYVKFARPRPGLWVFDRFGWQPTE